MQVNALVTGATGDIGQAICLKLASAGYHVIIHYHKNRQCADKLLTTIHAQGDDASTIQFDVANALEVEACLQNLLKDQVIQIVVNNAGIHDDAPMAGMNLETWNKVIDISLNGFFNVTKPLLMAMIKKRWGRIINISSIAGIKGNRGQCNYAAAKAGLIGATKSLAQELASRNITVNAVAPGIIASSMTKNVFSEEQIKQWVPMKRAGEPEEVANLVAFLASRESSYISGQVISVDGAMS